jgi:ferredoxin
VNQLLSVRSDECSLCLECVESCPVSNTLGVSVAFTHRRVWPIVLALSIIGIFLAIFVYGRLSGHWQTSVTPQQMVQQVQELQSTDPHHP